jgi:hypothetical protein
MTQQGTPSSALTSTESAGPLTYERMATKSSSHLLFTLPMVGAAIFFGCEALIYARSDVHYPIMELIYGTWLCFIPAVVMWFQRRWFLVHSGLLDTVSLRTTDVSHEEWLSSRRDTIFGLAKPLPWTAVLLVTLLGTSTLFVQRSPYGDPVVDGILLAVFSLVLSSAGYGAYLLGACLWFLRDLCNAVESAPFFGLEGTAIRRFESAWLLVGLVTGGTYFVVLGATVKSPYGIHGVFATWMWVAATLPLLCLSFVFALLHRFRVTLKAEQLDRMSAAINALATRQGSFEDPALAANLASLADLFDRLRAAREWPISSVFTSSLFLSIIPIIGQAMISWKLSGPH